MKIINYLILIILFLSSCNNKNDNIYKFKTSIFTTENEIPIVNINLNGKNTNLIIDTGSEISIIDKKYYYENIEGFNVCDSLEMTLNTLNGEQLNKVYLAKGIINDSINVMLYVIDISNTIDDIFIKQQTFVNGIIGIDFIYDNELVLDFKNKTLSNL